MFSHTYVWLGNGEKLSTREGYLSLKPTIISTNNINSRSNMHGFLHYRIINLNWKNLSIADWFSNYFVKNQILLKNL